MLRNLTPSGMGWDYHHRHAHHQQLSLRTSAHSQGAGAVVIEPDWLSLKTPCEPSHTLFLSPQISAASSIVKPLDLAPSQSMDLGFITAAGDGIPSQLIERDLFASIVAMGFPQEFVQA